MNEKQRSLLGEISAGRMSINQAREELGLPAIQSSNDALVYVSMDAIGDEREKRDRARGGYLTREAKAE